MNDELVQVLVRAYWREEEKILTAEAEKKHLEAELAELGRDTKGELLPEVLFQSEVSDEASS